MKNPRTTEAGRWVRLAAPLAAQLATIALTTPLGHADAAAVANLIRGGVSGFQQLLLLIAMALLGAGIALKFLPVGSHRTKETAGQLFDNALILGGLIALGLYLVSFAGQVTTAATGMGSPPEVSSPWEVPRG